jgi:hypothetical protein
MLVDVNSVAEKWLAAIPVPRLPAEEYHFINNRYCKGIME